MTKLPRARGTAWSRCRARLQRPGRPCHDLGSAADGAAIGRAVLGQAPVPWREKSPLKKWGFRIFGQERMGIQDAQGLKKKQRRYGACTSKSLENDFPLRNYIARSRVLCVFQGGSHTSQDSGKCTREMLYFFRHAPVDDQG